MRKSFLPRTKSARTLVLDLQLLELLEIHVCGLSHPNNRKCYNSPSRLRQRGNKVHPAGSSWHSPEPCQHSLDLDCEHNHDG